MKHKHAELIKAWADGAQIERKELKVVSHPEPEPMVVQEHWVIDFAPSWNPIKEYRIKPEEKKTVVKYLWAIDKGNGFALHPFFVADGSIPYPSIRYGAQRLDWSRTEFEE